MPDFVPLVIVGSRRAAGPALARARGMAVEMERLFAESEGLFDAADAAAEMRRFLDARAPETADDLMRGLDAFLDSWSPDEAGRRISGPFLAAQALSYAHAHGRMAGGWPGIDAFEHAGFWRDRLRIPHDLWGSMAAESVVAARMAAAWSVGEAAGRMVAVVRRETKFIWLLAALKIYSNWQAKRAAAEKAKQAQPGDVVIYVTMGDDRVRPNHAALDGFTFRYGSTVSRSRRVWAPKGPRCRCSNQIVKGEAARDVAVAGEAPRGSESDPGWDGDPKRHPAEFINVSAVPREVRRKLDMMPIGAPKVVDLGPGGVVDLSTYRADGAVRAAWRTHENSGMYGGRMGRLVRGDGEAYYGKAAMDALDDADMEAIASYMWHWDGIMNRALRTGAWGGGVDSYAKMTASSLNSLPRYRGMTYRGAGMPPDFLKSYQRGVIVTPKGFSSTSGNRYVATEFAYMNRGRGAPVVYEIRSRSGRDITPLSFFSGEHEVVYNPGTSFRVVGRRVEDRYGMGAMHIIEMEEI